MARPARLALATLAAFTVFIGWGEAQSPTPGPAPKADGPVQGYHGGYDPTDKSKAPAAPDGKTMDRGNADEGRRGKSVSGAITAIDGRKLTLDSGMVLVVPPTVKLDQNMLTVGVRIMARYEDQGGSHVVITIRREPS
ncbi:MAG TPA: hypothetical protein VIE41_18400 [Methylomirabilota bacterium]